MNTLNITKNIIKKYNIKANKRFGQNFLIDDNILENIILSSNIQEHELIIEIGPGLGNLSEYLVKSSDYVLLIEIDNNMISILNDRLANYTNYELLNQDILKLDIDKKIEEIEKKNLVKYSKVKVIANLPYYITSPIIFKLLEDSYKIDEIVVMVQKEVAERITAKSGNKDYGILTIMVDSKCDANIETIVPRESFIPEPNVDSAVIKLVKNKKYDIKNQEIFKKLVSASFSQRRKKMLNSLSNSACFNFTKSDWENIFNKNDISLDARAEQLNIKDFIKISNYISK